MMVQDLKPGDIILGRNSNRGSVVINNNGKGILFCRVTNTGTTALNNFESYERINKWAYKAYPSKSEIRGILIDSPRFKFGEMVRPLEDSLTEYSGTHIKMGEDCVVIKTNSSKRVRVRSEEGLWAWINEENLNLIEKDDR
jgi:hypothetical protein